MMIERTRQARRRRWARRSRQRDRSRPVDSRPENGTYRDVMQQPSPGEVAIARFSRFVARELRAARRRGMTDPDIVAATGVGSSTFHRWQAGQMRRLPDWGTVARFCHGLGLDEDVALRAMGMTAGRGDEVAPAPALPPDVREILRRLADPDVPDQEKYLITETLRSLAARRTGRDTEHNDSRRAM